MAEDQALTRRNESEWLGHTFDGVESGCEPRPTLAWGLAFTTPGCKKEEEVLSDEMLLFPLRHISHPQHPWIPSDARTSPSSLMANLTGPSPLCARLPSVLCVVVRIFVTLHEGA